MLMSKTPIYNEVKEYVDPHTSLIVDGDGKPIKSTLNLTKMEVNHILNLIFRNLREASYSGNKGQYKKRSHIIADKLEIYESTL